MQAILTSMKLRQICCFACFQLCSWVEGWCRACGRYPRRRWNEDPGSSERHSAALNNAEQCWAVRPVPSACQYPFLSNLYKSLYSLAALLISHKIEMAKTTKKKISQEFTRPAVWQGRSRSRAKLATVQRSDIFFRSRHLLKARPSLWETCSEVMVLDRDIVLSPDMSDCTRTLRSQRDAERYLKQSANPVWRMSPSDLSCDSSKETVIGSSAAISSLLWLHCFAPCCHREPA